MPITALPSPPSRSDPTNFADKGDAFLGALPTFVTQANTLATGTNTNETNAATSATNAASSATGAATSATNAATSATASATSATASATSATASATSATASAASAASAAAIAGAFVSTSTTSWTPAIESRAFTVQAGEQYSTGIFVTIVSASLTSNWGFGQVTAYSGTTLTVDVQVISGNTVKTDWNISLTGTRGATGATGAGITNQSVGFTLTGGTTARTFTGDVSLTASDVLVTSNIGVTAQAYDANLTAFVGAFTLPTVDGAANQILKTNGAGGISFGGIPASFNYASFLKFQ